MPYFRCAAARVRTVASSIMSISLDACSGPPKRCSDARSVVAFSRRTLAAAAIISRPSLMIVSWSFCAFNSSKKSRTPFGSPTNTVIALETAFDTDLFSIEATIFNFVAVLPSTFAEIVDDKI